MGKENGNDFIWIFLQISISKYVLKKVIIFKELLAMNIMPLSLKCPVADRSMIFHKGSQKWPYKNCGIILMYFNILIYFNLLLLLCLITCSVPRIETSTTKKNFRHKGKLQASVWYWSSRPWSLVLCLYHNQETCKFILVTNKGFPFLAEIWLQYIWS